MAREGEADYEPIESVSRPVMNALRRVENIELAIDGRDNVFAPVRTVLKEAPDE